MQQALNPSSYRETYDTGIPLLPAQAVSIHGWLKPIRRLNWKLHVVPRKDLTFAALVDKMKLCDDTLMALHRLQPDAKQWIHLEKVTIEDCEVMHRFWNIHPIRDFHVKDELGIHEVKLGEILLAGLSFECLKGCNVTLEDLAKAGLNPDNMRLFHFTLCEWKQLGFKEEHTKCMSSAQIEQVFGVPKHVLDASFLEQ